MSSRPALATQGDCFQTPEDPQSCLQSSSKNAWPQLPEMASRWRASPTVPFILAGRLQVQLLPLSSSFV